MKNDPHDLDMISQNEGIDSRFYDIAGLKIKKANLDDSIVTANGSTVLGDPKYRYITYTSFLCEITIATDDMGTQICYNGVFFGSNFVDLEQGVRYLRLHTKGAKIIFRAVYLNQLRQKFTWGNLMHQYWRVRHYFDPTFYFGR